MAVTVLGLAVFLLCFRYGSSQLSDNFYANTCPQAESIIQSSIAASSQASNVVPIALLRLFAHDCFTDGCDGSILISSNGVNTAERDNPGNSDFPQNPFDAVASAKQAVEAACPGVVSCADILALAARDSVVLSGGPSWNVLKGRRDGTVSQSQRVNLPSPDFDVSQLASYFQGIGLNLEEMVALSGAHTIGFAHCDKFANRLGGNDQSLDPAFEQSLQNQCPAFFSRPNTLQALDVNTAFTFDSSYYQNLQQGQGLLFSDQALFSDASTRPIVDRFASDQNAFFNAFASAMIKFSTVGVKTGDQGEIRQDCTTFNS